MAIYNVSIQLGLLKFLKLMMGILQYQPSSEKTFPLDVPSTQLNELVFMRNPMTFPKATRKSTLFKFEKKNQNQTLESNPLLLQLNRLFYTWQTTSYLHWNIIRKFQTRLGFESLIPESLSSDNYWQLSYYSRLHYDV